MSAQINNVSKSFFWSFLEQGGSSIASLVIQIVLARLLAPEVFGVMAILLVINGVLGIITQSGLGSALIQNQNISSQSFSTALWLSIGMSALLYCLCFFSAPFIAQFYGMEELALYLRVLTLVLFLDAFNSIQRSYLQKDLNFKALFKSNFAAVLTGGFVGIILAILGFGLWALIAQVAVQAIVVCIVMLVQVPWRPTLELNIKEAKELFSYGWKIGATGILNTLYTGLSELIIGSTNSKADLGYLSQGRKWPVAAMGAVVNALQNVLFPVFSELQDNLFALRSAVKKSLLSSSYISIPLCILAAVIAEPVVAILLTEMWLPCVPVFQMACLGYSLAMPQVVNLRAYMALGDSGLFLKLQIIKVLTGIILFSGVAIFTKNIYFVALAVMLHAIFSVIIVDMQPAKRMLGFRRSEQLRCLFPIILLSCFAAAPAFLISLLDISYLLEMILQIIAFCSIYVVGSKIAKVNGFDECVLALKSLIGKQ